MRVLGVPDILQFSSGVVFYNVGPPTKNKFQSQALPVHKFDFAINHDFFQGQSPFLVLPPTYVSHI